tara:strand:- start:142 stop:777 length:636 start_codon:yes stop_codon:yes gene_type:complete
MIHSKLISNGQFNDLLDEQKTELSLVNKVKKYFLNETSSTEKFNGLKYASMLQSHSDIVLEVDMPGIYKADAIITKQKMLALVVKTADCMPILISDNEKIGVIHIGWKGIENKIFYKTISKFNLSELRVSIGPHAQKCCYEVKEDLEVKFSQHCIKKENKTFLDLSSQIREFCEVNEINLEVIDVCTIENKKYNSYRRDKTKNRQSSKIWI